MKPFLEPVMNQIKHGLQMRGYVATPDSRHLISRLDSKKNAPSEEPMFQCVGMLASAVGPNLTKLLHDQLDLMFACGLSEPLRQALTAITRHIPPLLKTIQGTFYRLALRIEPDAKIRQTLRSIIGSPQRPTLQTTWRPHFHRSSR